MPEIRFTPQLRRFVAELPELQSEAGLLITLLEQAFAAQPRLRAYVLDDQGEIRPNVAIFVDGSRTLDLQQQLEPHSKVAVLQALSGG